MNYDKLVFNLRQKAFNYNGIKGNQFDRILKEAVKRKINQYKQTNEFKKRYSSREQRLLFMTR